MNIPVLVTVCSLTSLSFVVFGIASFGNGLFFQTTWQICHKFAPTLCDGEIGDATMYVTLGTVITTPVQVWILRSFVDTKLALHLSLTQCVGVYFGMNILFGYNSPWLPRLLGASIYAVALHRLVSIRTTSERDMKSEFLASQYDFCCWHNYIFVWITGLSSGVLAGMYAAGGPPIVVFFSFSGLSKDVTRSTVAFSSGVLNMSRVLFLVIRYLQGDEDVQKQLEECNLFDSMFITLSASFGLIIGNALSGYINQTLFMYIVLSLLVSGAVMLGAAGSSAAVSFYINVISIGGIVAAIVLTSAQGRSFALALAAAVGAIASRPSVQYDMLDSTEHGEQQSVVLDVCGEELNSMVDYGECGDVELFGAIPIDQQQQDQHSQGADKDVHESHAVSSY
jgi:predicted secreted protein